MISFSSLSSISDCIRLFLCRILRCRNLKKPFKNSSSSFLLESLPSCWGSEQCFAKKDRLQLEVCMSFTKVGFWMIALSDERKILPKDTVYLSPSCLSFIGKKQSVKESRIAFWTKYIHPDDLPRIRKAYGSYILGDSSQPELVQELRLRHKKNWHWVQATAKLFVEKDQNMYIGGLILDVTQSHQLQEKLEKQTAFQQGLLEILPNPVFIKDEQANFITFNRAYEEAFGIKREDFIGKSVLNLPYLSKSKREHYHKESLKLVSMGGTRSHEIDLNFADGEQHHCLYWNSGLRDQKNNVYGLIGLIVDITKQQKTEQALAQKIEALNKANAEIERISRTDDLTGLANRRAIINKLEATISISNRHSQVFSLIMSDVDNFKNLNDTFGHGVGDTVLQRLATIAIENCRKEDTLARIGGEEFLFLLPLTTKEGAIKTAKKIHAAIHNSTEEPAFTLSTGVVQYDINQPEGIYDIIKRADDMMYRAKKSGKNCICSE